MNTQQQDVTCAVTQLRGGKTKTPFPHSHLSVWKTQKKGTNYARIYNFRTVSKLSLSPLTRSQPGDGNVFHKTLIHLWKQSGKLCFSITSALMLSFLQAAIPSTKPARLQYIRYTLLSFPRHQATEKHM